MRETVIPGDVPEASFDVFLAGELEIIYSPSMTMTIPES